MFDLEIKQPQHDKIVLRTAHANVLPNGRVAIGHIVSHGEEPVVLDENDAIRLAAFLNRWYRERNQAELAAQRAEIAAARAAKERRYQARKAARGE